MRAANLTLATIEPSGWRFVFKGLSCSRVQKSSFCNQSFKSLSIPAKAVPYPRSAMSGSRSSTSTQPGISQTLVPSSPDLPIYAKSIFLAGTTTRTNSPESWRERLKAQLADLPLTIYDPHCSAWGKDWNDPAIPDYRKQVDWELDKQDEADLVVVYFEPHPTTPSPISLLELGLCAKENKAVVCTPKGYMCRGNVMIVCERLNIKMVEDINDFRQVIIATLDLA